MTDQTPFGTALRERVQDEHPDLDRLISSSTRAGTRIRRVRRGGAALAAAAGVAVVAVGVAALQGSDGPTTDDSLPIATQPTSAAPSETTETTNPSITLAELESELEKLANMSRHNEQALADSPVQVTAAGWRCDEPADEKFMCSKLGAFVVVNWRDAASHDAYLDPGKADTLDGVHTFVSDVRGAWFATVAPAQGTTQEEVDEVGRSLVWVRD